MKNKFLYSTFILIVGGMFTKILGLVIKVIIARIVGSKGLGSYMLLLPTFMLLINLGQFGFPIALSKLISEENRNNKKLIFSVLPFLFALNLFLMIIIILLAPIISTNLLHNPDAYISVVAMSFVIPFTTISSLCRSYFFGKNRMEPHVISHIVEDLARLLIIIKVTPLIIPYGIKYTTCFLILINIFSEIISTVALILFLPKNIKITKNDLVPNKKYLEESLKISIPNTASRLIGSIAYFLEPIIITNVLFHIGYKIDFITSEYGIITGYVVPLVLLPSFFALALSDALLPIISKEYINNNINIVKRKINLSIFFSLCIGISYSIVLFIFPKYFLFTVYHTNKGFNYLKALIPFTIFQYIQYPLSSTLEAIGRSNDNLFIAILSAVVRIISLIMISLLKIGLWSLIISMIINILFTTLILIKKVRYYLTLKIYN